MELIERIRHLLVDRGRARYGSEAVNQLDHALQTAWLAEQAGSKPSLVVAALLHDLGHLMVGEDEHAALGFDDQHEALGAHYLAGWLGRSVAETVRLHVAAKRYLCHAEPDYAGRLSQASQASLRVQGGVFTPAQAEEFIQQDYAREAVSVRRWDESAKVPGQTTPDLEHFLPIVAACLEG